MSGQIGLFVVGITDSRTRHPASGERYTNISQGTGEQLSECVRGYSIGLKKTCYTNREICGHLERNDAAHDSGKNDSTTTGISVRIVTVDRGLQQRWKTELLSEQLSQHRIRRHQLSAV
ncbi:hypothetical protein TNCV_3432881 [Trichonephila clavipes]|nr:hypothetical protein TNCV_3432881 [Trichonephila clavipes]